LTRILFGRIGHGYRKNMKGHRHGEAWRKYDEWWKEVGEQSYSGYSAPPKQ
jgi:hypothetical protein